MVAITTSGRATRRICFFESLIRRRPKIVYVIVYVASFRRAYRGTCASRSYYIGFDGDAKRRRSHRAFSLQAYLRSRSATSCLASRLANRLIDSIVNFLRRKL